MMIKVCGIREKENMMAVAALRPGMMGFIFYPGSPRYMAGTLLPENLAVLPVEIAKVGVFVDQEAEEIVTYAAAYSLNAVQLHGQEDATTCQSIRDRGYIVIKAWGIHPGFNFKLVDDYAPCCDYFLFDTAAADKHGGTGKSFDWNILKGYGGETPFLLSGGIGAEHVQAISALHHPAFAGIDVNSRFESSPGVKNISLLSAFMGELHLQQS